MEIQNQKPEIKIQDLNVIYNKGKSNEVRALENINLEINPREYVIIFGPSGCGKSTLLYAISGLQRPTSGVIEVGGDVISQFNKNSLAEFHRYRIGMVFQAFYLIESLSVLDNVCLPKIFDEQNEKERTELAMKLLSRFGMDEYANRFPSELSGGQKQRVSVARSLVNDPGIIMADEPVGNLDSKSAHNVMEILQDLNEKDKKTVILVTHDPAHLQYGDKVVYMMDGKITKVELVKRKKIPDLESYIFKKEGGIKEDLKTQGLVREEFIPPDLRMLMKSFRGLSASQIGALLVPFKVQQLFTHIFFSSLSDDQISVAKKKLEDFLFERLSFDEFVESLDNDMSKEGAGWDKRTAKNFSTRANMILKEVSQIDFSNPEKTSKQIAEYLDSLYEIKMDKEKIGKFSQIIFDRIGNRIGRDEFVKIVDMSEKEGGLGMNKRTAQKISQEMEVILLLRYSA